MTERSRRASTPFLDSQNVTKFGSWLTGSLAVGLLLVCFSGCGSSADSDNGPDEGSSPSAPVTAPLPVKSEPVKSEPVKSEPVKSEPVKSEPVKSEPVKSEPVKSEPVAEPSKPKAPSDVTAKKNETPALTQVRIPLINQKTWGEMDDPRRDGWQTEVLAAEAGEQLKGIVNLLTGQGIENGPPITSLITDDFACQPLYPSNSETAFDDKLFRVVRAEANDTPANEGKVISTARSHRGRTGLTAAIQGLVQPYAKASNIKAKFKVFRIELTDVGFKTQQYLTITGQSDSERIETHATWLIDWTKHTQRVPPRIRSIAVDAFEMTEARQGSAPLLVDCAESILKDTPCYEEQLRRGLNYWIERCQQTRYAFILGTPGIAVGDANGDGLDDIYLCQHEGFPNRLFLQQTDGTVEEVSQAWGVDWTNDSRGALFIDIDNDGDQDLIVATLGGIAIAKNDNQQRYLFQTMHATEDDTMSLASADYDQDGDLDVYVTAYSTSHLAESAASGVPGASRNFIYHDSNNGAQNSFFVNDGSGNFHEATAEVGLDMNNHRFSMSAAWDDYDNDGDADLYVANDYGRDNLYENQGGKFIDVAEQAHVENGASGMSAAWGDFDRNGHMDVYVSNMFSAAGNRITFQDQFRKNHSPHVKTRLQRFARGNTLLKNRGDTRFDDVSLAANVNMGRWAWGSNFADLNNDGWQDLLVANGYVTDDDSGDL